MSAFHLVEPVLAMSFLVMSAPVGDTNDSWDQDILKADNNVLTVKHTFT